MNVVVVIGLAPKLAVPPDAVTVLPSELIVPLKLTVPPWKTVVPVTSYGPAIVSVPAANVTVPAPPIVDAASSVYVPPLKYRFPPESDVNAPPVLVPSPPPWPITRMPDWASTVAPLVTLNGRLRRLKVCWGFVSQMNAPLLMNATAAPWFALPFTFAAAGSCTLNVPSLTIWAPSFRLIAPGLHPPRWRSDRQD